MDVLAGGFHQNIGQGFQFSAGIGSPRRVGRAVQHQPLGLGVDRLAQLVRLQLEIRLCRAVNQYRLPFHQGDDICVADPEGGGDQDFIARIHCRHECVENGLLAAGSNRDLGNIIIQTVVALQLAGNRLTQLWDARGWAIFGFARSNRVIGGLFDMFRGIEIRFPGTKADNIDALCFQFVRLCGHRNGRGGLDSLQSIGKKGHGPASS